MRSSILAILLALGSLAASATSIQAGGNYPPRPACSPADCCPPQYERVLTYQCRTESYTVCETRYDDCGRPYRVTVVRQRTVRVPVWQYVRVN